MQNSVANISSAMVHPTPRMKNEPDISMTVTLDIEVSPETEETSQLLSEGQCKFLQCAINLDSSILLILKGLQLCNDACCNHFNSLTKLLLCKRGSIVNTGAREREGGKRFLHGKKLLRASKKGMACHI